PTTTTPLKPAPITSRPAVSPPLALIFFAFSIMGLARDSLSNSDKINNVDKQFLSAPIKSAVDKFQLIPEFLKMRGLVKEHIDSYNYFINTGMRKIVRVNSEIRSTVDPEVYLRFLDVKIGEPSVVLDGVAEKINPQSCRLSNMTYAAPIIAQIEYITESGGQYSQRLLVSKVT
ncbi:DNA-directed RNA polymerase III subunit 2, partial [Bienertia sinuspersici]